MSDDSKVLIGSEYPRKAVELFNQAKYEIDLCVFDWRWYPTEPGGAVGLFNASLASAVKRGVRVRAVVNSDDIARRLRGIGVDVHRIVSPKLLHAKVILVDDSVGITGSHNFTAQAFAVNLEVSVVLTDVLQLKRIKEFFETVWLL